MSVYKNNNDIPNNLNNSVNSNFSYNYYPYSNRTLSTNASLTKSYNYNVKLNITFYFDFSTGQTYTFNDNPYNIFASTLDKFIKKNFYRNIKDKIKCVICNANKVDFNKTLLENNINQNSHVFCYIDNQIDINDTFVNTIIQGVGFKFYGLISKAGRDQNGYHKINQDSSIVCLNIGNIKGFNLFGVIDGHGLNGDLLSQFCRDYFILQLNLYANQCKLEFNFTPEGIYNKLKLSDFKFIKDCFKNVDIEMTKQLNFEYNFSGASFTLVIQLKHYLICANVGNSRSILIFDNDTNTNQGIFNLSEDHTPYQHQEKIRIIDNKGMIAKHQNKFGKIDERLRVYKLGHNYPGLLITRSLGDFIGKECGVINKPHIIELKKNHNFKYMVIGSEGIWRAIKNEDVRNLGNIYYQKGEIGNFCKDLVTKAVENWAKIDICRDDITLVCVYF